MFHILILLLVSLTHVISDDEVGPFCPGETPYSFNDKKSCCEFPVDPFDPYCDGKEATWEFLDRRITNAMQVGQYIN